MPAALRVSRFLYSRLLIFYPQELRSRFKAEMLQVFEDVLGDAIRQRGPLGIVSPWCLALWELATVAAPLRLQAPAMIAPALSFIVSSVLFLALFRALS